MASKKWLSLAVVLAMSCGNDKDKNSTSGPADASDVATQDMGSAPDGAQPEDFGADGRGGDDAGIVDRGGCPNGINTDVTIDIDPGEYAGQFYARAAWDGQGAWVIYNRPDSAGADNPEQIFATHVGCDGAILHGPLRLSAANGARNYMPVVASRGGITHVAWVEQAAGANPGTVLLAILASDGTVTTAAPIDITPSDANGPVSDLAWEPDIAIWADGSGVLATSTGTFGSLDVALQRYGADGTRTGDAFFPYVEAGVDQKRPTVAAAPDGTVYVGWTRFKAEDGTPEEAERAVFTSIPAGANMAFPAAPLPAKPLTSPNPIARYAKEPGANGAFFLAFQVTTANRQDILVRNGADFQTADSAAFGSAGWANFRPSIASGKAGGVLAWYRYNESPLRNTVMVHPFAYNGAITPGSELAIETASPGIPPYGPDVTWAGGSVYFVVWGEGARAPDARVKGRWVIVGR